MLEDALSALGPSSILCTVAQAWLTRGWAAGPSVQVHTPDASFAGTVSFQTALSTGVALLSWLRTAGKSLTDLTVDRRLEESLIALNPASYSATLSNLRNNCPALRRWHICSEDCDETEVVYPTERFIDDILRVVGHRLHELHACNSYSFCISEHCTGLRSLILESHVFQRDLRSLLSVVGPTLEEFELRTVDNHIDCHLLSTAEVRLLQELCPSFSHICLREKECSGGAC